MSKSLLIKGASVLGGGQVVVAASTFFRNLIIARMISVENFGIATTFAITLSLIEMTSNLAFDKLLVQDKDGGGDELLDSAHFLQAMKCITTSLILFLSAPLFAHLFGIQDVVWAFQILSLVPLMSSLTHFDVVTFQRSLKFGPTALMDTVPQLITLLAAYPLALWLNDYRAVLCIAFLQPLSTTTLSHIFAVRPYRWKINKSLIIRKLNFGWPLMINGILLFAIFNGEKTIVGSLIGMETLGWFGATFALTLMPTLLFAKVCTTLFLPTLSKSRGSPENYLRQSIQITIFCFSIAAFTWLFFFTAGRAVIELSYGEKYLAGGAIIAWLALMQSVRIIRVAPTLIALSQADTKNSMIANLFRITTLPLSVYLAAAGYPLVWMVVSSILGEIIATFASVVRLNLSNNTSTYRRYFVRVSIAMIAPVFFILAISNFTLTKISINTHPIATIFIGLLVATLFSALFLLSNQYLRATVGKIIKVPM